MGVEPILGTYDFLIFSKDSVVCIYHLIQNALFLFCAIRYTTPHIKDT